MVKEVLNGPVGDSLTNVVTPLILRHVIHDSYFGVKNLSVRLLIIIYHFEDYCLCGMQCLIHLMRIQIKIPIFQLTFLQTNEKCGNKKVIIIMHMLRIVSHSIPRKCLVRNQVGSSDSFPNKCEANHLQIFKHLQN